MNLLPAEWTPKAVTQMILQIGAFIIVGYLLIMQKADTNSVLAIAAVMSQFIAGAIGSNVAGVEATKNLQGVIASLQAQLSDFEAVGLSPSQRVTLDARRQMRAENEHGLERGSLSSRE